MSSPRNLSLSPDFKTANCAHEDATNSNDALPTIFVGRQPIFDQNNEVVAYELLYRSSELNSADVQDDECATAELLLNTFSGIGLEHIVGDLTAFINVSESFILNHHALALPKDRVVIEVLETVEPKPEILAELSTLKDLGYTIALDDFVYSPDLLPFVELADIIKVDLVETPESQLPTHLELLRKYNVKLLAEKVETHEQYEFCRSLSFDYYQGYFFCRPEIVKGTQLSTNRLTLMRLVARLQDPNVEIDEITEIIRTEPLLSVKLLRFVNSIYCSLDQQIDSIGQAVTLAGIRRIRTLCNLSVLTQVTKGRSPQFIQTILVRAKMAELLGQYLRQKTDTYFLVGLFSALDNLSGMPMQQALDVVCVSTEVEQAIISHEGLLGTVLTCVLEYEKGNWDKVFCPDLDSICIQQAYMDSLEWARQAIDSNTPENH